MDVDLGEALDPNAVGDAGVPNGGALLAFASAANGAAAGSSAGDIEATRTALRAAVGDIGLIEAAATVAVFNGLVRAADGTGIELDSGVFATSADFRDRLGVDQFAGAANTRHADSATNRTASESDVGSLFGA